MIMRMAGLALIVLGDVLLIIALTADPLGLGWYPTAIGWVQISAAVAAIVIQLAGMVLSQVESKPKGIVR